jgi:hypothetical protein
MVCEIGLFGEISQAASQHFQVSYEQCVDFRYFSHVLANLNLRHVCPGPQWIGTALGPDTVPQ